MNVHWLLSSEKGYRDVIIDDGWKPNLPKNTRTTKATNAFDSLTLVTDFLNDDPLDVCFITGRGCIRACVREVLASCLSIAADCDDYIDIYTS